MRASLVKPGDRAAQARALLADLSRLLPRPQMAFGQDRAVSPGITWRFWLGATTITLLAILWRASQRYSAQVQDLFQLYYGAKAWRLVGTAYDLAPVVPLADQTLPQFQAGNAYPFPAVLDDARSSWLPVLALPVVVAVVWHPPCARLGCAREPDAERTRRHCGTGRQ